RDRGGAGAGWQALGACDREARAGRAREDVSTDQRPSRERGVSRGDGAALVRKILLRDRRRAEGGVVSAVGKALPHESARGHVTGDALYTDDLVTRFAGALHAWPVCAPHAHARVVKLETGEAAKMPGVHAVLTAADVPGDNDTGAARH